MQFPTNSDAVSHKFEFSSISLIGSVLVCEGTPRVLWWEELSSSNHMLARQPTAEGANHLVTSCRDTGVVRVFIRSFGIAASYGTWYT